MMNILVVLNLGSYMMMLMFFTYACIIADTRKSRFAVLFQIVLPSKCSNLSKKILGEGIFNFLTGSEDRFLNWLYICIVFSSWIIIFVYTYPWIDATHGYIPSYHKFLGYWTFLSCVASWRLAATKSPGIITAQTIEKYDNYPYDGNLYIRGRTCPTVGIPKIARSKFDRITGVHVAKFDHFCGWLGNTIGEENYRWFLLFLLIHTIMLCYGTVIVVALFKYEIEKNQLWDMMYIDGFTGEQRKATSFIVFQYLFLRHRLHMALLFMFAALSIVLFGFLLFHIWITSRGMTTNEAFKWKKIRKSYRLQLLQYEAQIEKRRLMKNAQPNDIGGSAKDVANVETNEVNHPGPMPQNIYNDGILSNWTDVFFPRSISVRVSENQLFHLKTNEEKQL